MLGIEKKTDENPASHEHGCNRTGDKYANMPNGWRKSLKRFFSKIDLLLVLSFAGVFLLFLSHKLLDLDAYGFPGLGGMAEMTYRMVSLSWFGVLLGMVSIGFLSVVPKDLVMSLLGPGGTFKGLVRACGAGVLFDLCSHGVLMVAVKLYEKGASTGQVIAFLVSSPWNSLSLTIILINLIGIYWTLTFIVLSVLIALITGGIFDYLVASKRLPKNKNSFELKEGYSFFAEFRKWKGTVNFDYALLKRIIISGIKGSKIVVKWLLFGILLASIVNFFLDPEQFKQYFGPTLIGLLFTVIFASILEVCSEGSAPLAANMITVAGAPGNSFAFLMVGASTDYTEIIILKEMTKSWKIALFLPIITLPQVVFISWLMNNY